MAQETQAYDNKEVDSIAKDLARTVVDNVVSTVNKSVNKAEFDKSFACTILGVNQIFSSDIKEDEQNEIIKTYNIPEVDTTANYYTVKIDGHYYCIKQNAVYSMGQAVSVVAPKGDIGRLYIGTGEGKSGEAIKCTDYEIIVKPKEWVEVKSEAYPEDIWYTNTIECSWSKSTFKTSPICDIYADEQTSIKAAMDEIFMWQLITDVLFEDEKVTFKSVVKPTYKFTVRVKVFE